MSLSCAEQQLTKENATHWAKGKIANNIRQCSFIRLLSLPKEKYVYSPLYKLCASAKFLANNALKKWGSSKTGSFPYKASTSTKQVVVIYNLVVAFELVQRNMFVKVGFFKQKTICVIYNVYCVLNGLLPLSW